MARERAQDTGEEPPVSFPAGIRPATVTWKRITRATGYRCELCGDPWPAHLLEIHSLPGHCRAPARRQGMHREILVLCSRCHHDLHGEGVSTRDQGTLVSLRDPRIAREIRWILLSPSPPYVAPDTFDAGRFFLDPSPVPWGWVV